ncbi:hypothetical protein, partial [Marinobacter halodurans]|uniref:hypothetical protein n=1 Tax=Marinobacter halodurans TaxID=2528979 RepID=UPI001A956242
VGLLTHLGKMVKAFGKAVRKQRLRRIWRDADLHRQTLLEDTAPSRVDGLELKAVDLVTDKLNTAQRIGRLDLEGHAPIRHGGINM